MENKGCFSLAKWSPSENTFLRGQFFQVSRSLPMKKTKKKKENKAEKDLRDPGSRGVSGERQGRGWLPGLLPLRPLTVSCGICLVYFVSEAKHLAGTDGRGLRRVLEGQGWGWAEGREGVGQRERAAAPRKTGWGVLYLGSCAFPGVCSI